MRKCIHRPVGCCECRRTAARGQGSGAGWRGGRFTLGTCVPRLPTRAGRNQHLLTRLPMHHASLTVRTVCTVTLLNSYTAFATFTDLCNHWRRRFRLLTYQKLPLTVCRCLHRAISQTIFHITCSPGPPRPTTFITAIHAQHSSLFSEVL